jgi:phosphoglucomutase
LARLSSSQVNLTSLAGEKITAILTVAPGNGAPIGGLKVVAESGWFAVRPSGTENIYKMYAESFRGPDHLRQIQAEAQSMLNDVLGIGPEPATQIDKIVPSLEQRIEQEAIEAWLNEGDPN